MREFKVNDNVICLIYGKGVITAVDNDNFNDYPISVKFINDSTKTFKRDGRHSLNGCKTLYHMEDNPRIITGEPVELLGLTNITKAVMWLEQGKRICSYSHGLVNQYVQKSLVSTDIYFYEQDTNKVVRPFTIDDLFLCEWTRFTKEENNVRDFMVGDKVYSLIYGEGIVTKIDEDFGDYSLFVQHEAMRIYTMDGRFVTDGNKVLYHADEKPIVTTLQERKNKE